MAPKGRSRKGNTRLDAAIDHMQMFGFSTKFIRDTVKQLLKVYGGDDGWIFIEEDSYKILIEALLEVQAEKERDDNVLDDTRCGAHSEMSSVATPTTEVAETSSSNSFKRLVPHRTETLCIQQRADVFVDSSEQIDFGFGGEESLSSGEAGGTHLGVAIPSTQNANKLAEGSARDQSSQMIDKVPARRRKPCYGWISDDDDVEEAEVEELDLVELKPAKLSKELEDLLSEDEDRAKRRCKSRWDVKPYDP